MIRPKLRLARNEDADYIREILAVNDEIPDGHDWSKIGPYWIVAEYAGRIVGCAQCLLGWPLGHIGFLAVLQEYQNSGIGAFLWRAAEQILVNHKCDGYTGMTDNKRVLKQFPKHGGVVFSDPVHVLFKRVK